jgi:hypothetical protein
MTRPRFSAVDAARLHLATLTAEFDFAPDLSEEIRAEELKQKKLAEEEATLLQQIAEQEKKELQALKEELEGDQGLRARSDKLTAELQTSRDELEGADGEEGLRARAQKLTAELQTSRDELEGDEGLRVRAKELASEGPKARARNLATELDGTEGREGLRAASARLALELNQLTINEKDMREKMSPLASELEEASGNAGLRADYAALESELEGAAGKSGVGVDHARLARELTELRAKNVKLESDVEESKARISALSSEVEGRNGEPGLRAKYEGLRGVVDGENDLRSQLLTLHRERDEHGSKEVLQTFRDNFSALVRRVEAHLKEVESKLDGGSSEAHADFVSALGHH